MKFTMTVSEEVFNTIITALRFEKIRAEEEGNENNLLYIDSAIHEIDKNTYVSNVMDVN